MGILDRFKKKNTVKESQGYQMITTQNHGFFQFNGNIYHSDIVRSAIRPKAQAIGKAVGTHVQEKDDGNDEVNPHRHIKMLLKEPNPYMTGQVFQEKMATQLEINNNAFAFINRDENGLPIELYPINAISVQVLKDENNLLYLRFIKTDGNNYVFRYSDIIHLRKDVNEDELFGESNIKSLTNLMETVDTVDQGIVKAVKNSNMIQWLLKFGTQVRDEDIEKHTKRFINSFMNVDSDTVGAAGIDNKIEAHQVQQNPMIPEYEQMNGTIERIYAFFNTNKNIVESDYTEDQWISYFEANIQPIIKQMSEEYTRKLFSRRQRVRGHKIVFNSESLSFASMETKLKLTELVDRGAMSINEFRRILNMPRVEHGDEYVRRLDTAPVEEDAEGNDRTNRSSSRSKGGDD